LTRDSVRFYVDVTDIATVGGQTQWLARYGKALKPGDDKKMFKEAVKVRDKNVKTNAKFEYDVGAAKTIALGTGGALLVVAGCAVIVGCGPAIATTATLVATNSQFALAA
jgi:hypothetical protein